MNPIEHVWDRMGHNVCKRNDVVTLDDLVRSLVDEWNNLDPLFLRKLMCNTTVNTDQCLYCSSALWSFKVNN